MKKYLFLYFLIFNIVLGINLDHIEIEKGNKGPEIEINYLNINKRQKTIVASPALKDYYLIQENTNLIKNTVLNSDYNKEYINKLSFNSYLVDNYEVSGINWLYSSILEDNDDKYKKIGISSSYSQLKNSDYFYSLNLFFNKNWNDNKDNFLIIASIGERDEDLKASNSKYFEFFGVYKAKYETSYASLYYSPYLEIDFIRYYYFDNLKTKRENIFIAQPGIEFKKIDFYKKYNTENILKIGYKQNILEVFNDALISQVETSILYNQQLKISIIYGFEKNIQNSNFYRKIGGQFEFKF